MHQNMLYPDKKVKNNDVAVPSAESLLPLARNKKVKLHLWQL